MQSNTYKADPQKTHNLKLASGLVIGLGMIPILFMALGAIKGHKNDLSEWGEVWWPIGAVVAVAGTIWAIYISYWYQAHITITHIPGVGAQVLIRDPNGDEMRAGGQWKWYAYYTKEYVRYGIYRKDKHLVLYCKDQAFVAIRNRGEMMDEPELPYVLMPGILNVDVPLYRTQEIDKVLQDIAGSDGAVQIQGSR